MIKTLLTLIFCLLPLIASAEKYYVFIDKIGKVDKGEETGHTAYGDVVGIHPFTPQYKPTRAELSRYKIMVVDLTDQERADLLEVEQGVVRTYDKVTISVSRRQEYIDLYGVNPNFKINKETIVGDMITIEAEFDEVQAVRARKRKVNINQLSHIKQEKEINKNEILQRVITKPTFISVQ